MFSRSFLGRITLTSHSARAGSAFALLALCAGCAAPSESVDTQRSAISVNPAVVISQIFGAGAASQAPYAYDYVELFNRSQGSASIDGWSVQYASAGGTGNFQRAVTLSGSLAPGQHYLVQLGPTATGVILAAPDATGATNIGGSAGKLVLVNDGAALACNGSSTVCSEAQLASIVDLVATARPTSTRAKIPCPRYRTRRLACGASVVAPIPTKTAPISRSVRPRYTINWTPRRPVRLPTSRRPSAP